MQKVGDIPMADVQSRKVGTTQDGVQAKSCLLGAKSPVRARYACNFTQTHEAEWSWRTFINALKNLQEPGNTDLWSHLRINHSRPSGPL